MRRVSAAPRHINDTWGTTPGIDTGEFRYKAFISYSWSDRKWGEWLHHALETYRAPKSLGGSRLHPIFKDREEEAAGASIGDAIETALGTSEFLIVLCSPRSAASPWVNREVAWFKANRDAKRILALIVDGEPMASAKSGREAEECFPRTLLFKVGADLSPTDEFEDAPLAADARESGDGKRGAKLKLAAAILGVGLDTLVNRDNRRRAQRRRIVMAGMAASIAVLSGITVFAVNQRNAAVAARIDADKQREEAQSLVEFMLTDLRQRLDAVGRLDILDAVAKRLNESYAKQDLEKLDADALGRRARVQLLLGEVDNTRGDLDAALAQYKEAASTTEELLKRNPGKAQQIFDHAQSVFWVGYIAWQRGDMAEAKKYFIKYYEYAQQLVAIDPDKDEWLMEKKYALNNLGTLSLSQGRLEEAEAYFHASLDAARRLAERRPQDADRQLAVGQSYAWLADSLYRQLEIANALDVRASELAHYRQALLTEPNHSGVKSQAVIAGYGFALLAVASGQLDLAQSSISEAIQVADEMAAREPENADFSDRRSFAYAVLGEVQLHLGRPDKAREALETARSIAEELVRKDPSIDEWKGVTLAQALISLARISARENDGESAVRQFENIEFLLKSLAEAPGADSIIVRRYCSALAGQARSGQSHASKWNKIVGMLEPISAEIGPEGLALLIEAYMRTDRRADALPITRKLFAAGFRHPDFVALLVEFPALQAAADDDAAAP